MDNKEIRGKILDYIYQKDEEKPRYMASRQELIDFMGIDNNKVDTNVLYLEDKGYLKLLKGMGALFFFAQITSEGKDLVEDPHQFHLKFPIHVTQNIISNSTGTVIGNNNIQNISISDSFKELYQEIERKSPEGKDSIIKEVKNIESELKKKNVEKLSISNSLEYLKQNAAWIIPIIIEIIKTAFGG